MHMQGRQAENIERFRSKIFLKNIQTTKVQISAVKKKWNMERIRFSWIFKFKLQSLKVKVTF